MEEELKISNESEIEEKNRETNKGMEGPGYKHERKIRNQD